MKIVTISDSPNIGSGLARVHRQVINGLIAAGHEVLIGGWHTYTKEELDGYIASKQKAEDRFYEFGGKKIKIFGMVQEAPICTYCAYDLINLSKADMVITIGDYRSFFYMHDIKKRLEYKFKWIPYFTLEEDVIPAEWKALFKYADKIIVPSKYGQETLKKEGHDAIVIPYGVDKSVFYPYNSEKRAQLRTDRGLQATDFRFITVAQNTWRKNLPSLILAAGYLKKWSGYRRGADRAKIFINTNVDAYSKSEPYLFDLIKLVKDFGVEDIVSFPKTTCSIFSQSPDTALADEYNVSDCLVQPATTEGYGLPIIEGMACGLPVIVNPTTAMTEHITEDFQTKRPYQTYERGIAMCNKTEIAPPARVIHMVDPEDMASRMCDIACFTAMQRDAMVEQCLSYVNNKTWEGMQSAINEVIIKASGDVEITVEVI